MKKTILILILFIFSQFTFAQNNTNIDNINSEESVENLINLLIEGNDKFTLKSIDEFESEYGMNEYCKRIADSLNITKPFYKADFDNNGLTDILAIGDYYDFSILIAMNYGQNSIELNRLTRKSFQECTFPKIINDTIIRYYYMSSPRWTENKKPTLQQKDLVFKFGDFIEFNPNPKTYNIEKIEYQTTMCFGTCPKFYIAINKDRTGIFKAERYNRETRDSKIIKGKFKTTLDKNSYSDIINLLNYIDFPNLKDNYSVNWTDDQTSTLTITYDNGQTKKIEDYGLIGTYGLDRLYQMLFELRFNQNWK